jgi:tetratricopeptide (TPR) repeat protein
VIGILIVLAALGGAQANAPSVNAPSLEEARRSINAGEPQKAIAQLNAIAASQDEAVRLRANLLLGVAYYQAGNAARAVEVLAPVVDRLAPGSIERREGDQVLGLAAVVAGKYAEAVPRLEATRRWAPDNQELAYALAQAYIQTRQPDAARRTLASIFNVDAESAAAHLLAAQVMSRLEMDGEAEGQLTQALAKDPRLPSANLLLGQIALFRGRVAEAIALTTRELAISPGNAMAFSQLGDAYVRDARWDDAIASLQKSIWLNPYYSAPYILLGRAYVKKDQPAVAEGMLRRAIEFDPNNRTAHYLLAQLLQQGGREEDAKREFEIADKLRSARER